MWAEPVAAQAERPLDGARLWAIASPPMTSGRIIVQPEYADELA